MTHDDQPLRVENALLRGVLWLTARALEGYHNAAHFEIDDDGRPMLEVIVPEEVREKAAAVLTKANELLKDQERGRGV